MSKTNNQGPGQEMEHSGLTAEELLELERQRNAALEAELAPFRAFRSKVNAGLRSAIVAGSVTDDEVDAMKDGIPLWQQGTIQNPIKYIEGDPYRLENGEVWICKQSHTCTSHVERPGTETLALWRRATPESTATWQENTEYIGPNDTQGRPQSEVIDPIDNLHYLCKQGHTSLAGWEPSKTPALWDKKE